MIGITLTSKNIGIGRKPISALSYIRRSLQAVIVFVAACCTSGQDDSSIAASSAQDFDRFRHKCSSI
jgi:hypothetical protein